MLRDSPLKQCWCGFYHFERKSLRNPQLRISGSEQRHNRTGSSWHFHTSQPTRPAHGRKAPPLSVCSGRYDISQNALDRLRLTSLRLTSCSPGLMRFHRSLSCGLALAAAAGLTLAGCTQNPKDAAMDAVDATGQAAKEAVTNAGQAALAPAVSPVLDLLKKSEGEVKGGNLGAAITAMSGFQGLWDKTAPVIQPLAGDKWPAIDSAARLVIKTFASGAQPDAAGAGSAITGLIGPLSSLLGK